MNNIKKIARKELMEMFRDKRVRFGAFIMPIFLVFLMVQMFGFIIGKTSGVVKSTLYIVGQPNPALDVFGKSGMVVKTVPTIDEGVKLIRAEKAQMVIAPMPPTTDGQVRLEAYYDPKQQLAQLELVGIEKAIAVANKQTLEATLAEKSIPTTAAEHIKVIPKEVQVGLQGAGLMIVGFLPYLIVLYAFVGGLSMASDMVAGEKEKNTLETLLITPVSRTDIVLGKFFALCSVCLLSSSSCLLGMFLASALKLPGSQAMFKDGFGVTPIAAATTLLLLVPLVAMFAGVLIAVSSYARNPREAQTYLALVNVLVIMPAIFSQIIGLTDLGSKLWINAVPVLNSANGIRNALLGKTDWTAVGITVVVSTLMAAIAISISVRLFNREQVLIRV